MAAVDYLILFLFFSIPRSIFPPSSPGLKSSKVSSTPVSEGTAILRHVLLTMYPEAHPVRLLCVS
jgi:hypothetical protein